jgi:hypothetical protein
MHSVTYRQHGPGPIKAISVGFFTQEVRIRARWAKCAARPKPRPAKGHGFKEDTLCQLQLEQLQEPRRKQDLEGFFHPLGCPRVGVSEIRCAAPR